MLEERPIDPDEDGTNRFIIWYEGYNVAISDHRTNIRQMHKQVLKRW